MRGVARDVIVIAILLAAGFAVLAAQHRQITNPDILQAEIRIGLGSHFVLLHENKTFYIAPHDHMGFEVRDGRIAFIWSNCTDQICVHSGFLGEAGQMAACLPNQALIIVGE